MAPARLRAFAFSLITVVVYTGALIAAPSFPTLTGRVVDQANVLDAVRRARLDMKLADLEAKNGTQLVVVTLPSLQGYDIADYGYQLGRHWGIGQKGKNTGALLIVAPRDRKVRIEVGYGLEGTLTDAVSRLIIDNAILPRFRAGDLPGGIERGVDDLVQVLSGDAEDFKKRAAERGARSTGEPLSAFAVTMIVVVIFIFLFMRGSRRQQVAARRRSGWIWGVPAGGAWSSGGWSSGGWSSGSGSDGGFSGGGGSFGGGGSSGSW
jgi:uncharacterized protein